MVKAGRRIDRRNWTHYNRWQSEEVRLACLFLKKLVDSSTIHDWERHRGRPRIPRRELVPCLLVRAYFHLSFRRTIGLLKLLGPSVGLARVPHFNTLQKYNRSDGLTGPWRTSLPRPRDRSGPPRRSWPSTPRASSSSDPGRGGRTMTPRRGRTSPSSTSSGTTSRATLAVRVTRGTWQDTTQLGPLLEAFPDRVEAEAVTGDGAYWNRSACMAARDAGLQPYFSPRENARWPTHPVDAFDRMTRFALQFPHRWGARYHRRSAAESRFATEKGLFGDRLRCRRPTSRRNEVLAREIVHNVRLLTKGLPHPRAHPAAYTNPIQHGRQPA